MTLIQLHLIAVSFWFGLIAAEVVLERVPKGVQARRTVALVHRFIDIYFEIPVIVLVLATGGLLLAGVWPGTPLLWVKIGAASIAIVANLVCFPLVHARWKTTDDDRARALTEQIGVTGLAIPFAIVAFVIGLMLTGAIA